MTITAVACSFRDESILKSLLLDQEGSNQADPSVNILGNNRPRPGFDHDLTDDQVDRSIRKSHLRQTGSQANTTQDIYRPA
jgi:hypothetical protein